MARRPQRPNSKKEDAGSASSTTEPGDSDEPGNPKNPDEPDTPGNAAGAGDGPFGGGSLGGFIRAQREMANLSLRQLSTMAEISNAYLSQIERDLHEPSLRVIKRVGNALGIAPETLLSRAGLLPDDDGGDGEEPETSTEDAIMADPNLSPDEKQALLTVYRSYVANKS